MYDYSVLLENHPDYFPSWSNFYDSSLTYPQNLLSLFKRAVFLPYDFYNILTVYALIPSALAKRVPYLFLYGVSGSGKSTVGKLIAHIHGITITSSETTYAAIRNNLRDRKHRTILVETNDPKFPSCGKVIEANIFMVWEDINANTFTKRPEIYNMFKFGYDKSCDTIQMSSEIKGKNETFRCFCPKVFSSIDPIHTLENFKELRRRLIVVPTRKIEDLTEERKAELGISDDNYQDKLMELDNIEWQGFSQKFKEFWDLNKAEIYLTIKNSLSKGLKGLNSTEKAISLDLITTGITTGIWQDEIVAVKELKDCFNWLKSDIADNQSPLTAMIELTIKQIETNAFTWHYWLATYYCLTN